MKKKACASLSAEETCCRELWKNGETTLLAAEVGYYTFTLEGKRDASAAARISRYYIHAKNALLRYCKTQLLPVLALRERAAAESGTPFCPLLVSATPHLCYNANGVLSLYTDISQRGEGLNATTRLGDVWSLSNGCPLPLTAFFPKGRNCRRLLREQICARIEAEQRLGFALYYRQYERLVARHFSTENYYLTQEGLVTFFPQGTIAPDVEGTPCFVHPWDPLGPVEPLLLL